MQRTHIGRDKLKWRGSKLFFGKRLMVEVVPDARWPKMFRVRYPNGELTDMVNLSRANDAAMELALGVLNAEPDRAQEPPGLPPVRFSAPDDPR